MVTQEYDLDADALYLKLAEGTFSRTVAIDDGCNVDLDAGGKLLGIEVLEPGSVWPLAAILRRFKISDEDAAELMAGYPFPPPIVSVA
jgi:uncharacterized protein YuzE